MKNIPIKKLFLLLDIGLAVVLACLAFVLFLVYDVEQELDQTQNYRYRSHILVNELRQSSDDLGRMARTFVFTKNSRYLFVYEHILDVRNGKQARPVHYERVNWENEAGWDTTFVLAPMSFASLLKAEPFLPDELTQLSNALIASNKSVKLEQEAMKMIEINADSAERILFSKDYLEQKSIVIESINRFYINFEERTDIKVKHLENRIKVLFIILSFLLLLTLVAMLVSYRIIRYKVTNPLLALRNQANSIANGDFSVNIRLNTNDEVGELARAINQLRRGLKVKADFARKIGRHEFDADFKPLSEKDELGNSLLKMRQDLQEIDLEQKQRAWWHETTSKLLEILNNEDFNELAQKLVIELVKQTDSIQGAIYFINNFSSRPYLELKAFYGGQENFKRKFELNEGLLGSCLEKGEMLVVEDIGKNIKVQTASFDLPVEHLLILPRKTTHESVGVLELGSVKKFQKHHLDFLKGLGERLALTIAETRSYQYTRELVNELKLSNEELLAQQEELQQNSEELQQITEQLQSLNDTLEVRVQERTAELLEINARMEIQQKELLQKNVLIEQQKAAVEETLDALKQAQAKLVHSEKMASLGQLTAGIAHELNNPINYISSGILGLRMTLEDVLEIVKEYEKITPENVKLVLERVQSLKTELEYSELIEGIEQLTNNISRGAERTAEIVRGLRTFSRLDESSFKLSDIHENIESTLVMLHSQYKNRIEVVREYGDIPKVECFPGKLNQVFMNLLVNAIQAIEMKANMNEEFIWIKTFAGTRNEQNYVFIEIKDTGGGIPLTARNKIFEPFFTTKEVGKGTGLGLSISMSIIETHKGIMEVESEDGIGTLFRILLPYQE